jgi:hypothetical protein
VGVSGCGLPRPTARCPAAEGERGVARLEEVGVVWVGEKDSEKEERRGGALYKDPASRPPSPPSSSTPLSDSRTTCHTRNQTAKSQTNSSTNKSNPRPRHGTRQHARLGLPQVRSRVRRLRQVVRFLWRQLPCLSRPLHTHPRPPSVTIHQAMPRHTGQAGTFSSTQFTLSASSHEEGNGMNGWYLGRRGRGWGIANKQASR